MKLYHLRYDTDDYGSGVAAVTASNPNQAEVVLKTNGFLNGTPNKYKVTKILEIGDCYSGDPELLNEENANLPSTIY